MVSGIFVISNSPGGLVDCRFLISRKPTLGRDINGEVTLSSMSVDSGWQCMRASVCVRVWAGGLFCSEAFLTFGMGVRFEAALAAAEGVLSMVGLLFVEGD